MFCKNCGKRIEEKSNLCAVCHPMDNAENETASERGFFYAVFKGRIGRLRYFLYTMYMGIAFSIFFQIILGLSGEKSSSETLLLSNLLSILFVPIIAKRLRDIGWSGYIAIALYVLGLSFGLNLIWIVICIGWGIILLFKKGDIGKNEYGDPKSDGKSIKRIALGLLVFFIFSIIILTIAPLFFN